MTSAMQPEHVDPVCCEVDIPLCRGESWGKPELGLGVVGSQGGVAVAEAGVHSPGLSVHMASGKQHRTGVPTRPCALAVQGLGGPVFRCAAGGC